MVDLTYSIADQNFATTKSIGIYNLSFHLAQNISKHSELRKLTIFSNSTITPTLNVSENARVVNHDTAIRGKLARMIWDQWGVFRQARKAGLPWLFLPKGFCSFLVRPQIRTAAYVHDIMGEHYRRNYPDFGSRLEWNYFGKSQRATLRNAELIFTNTEFTKSEILRYTRQTGMTEPKVIVAGYGFEPLKIERTEKADRVLLFASKWPHKRTDIAIRQLEAWVKQSNFKGVIDCIGILSPDMEKPGGPHWNWIGRVPPLEGREMIRKARAVIYVSEYEGFGMPPVEAVMEGTCPVFSDIPPLREVMGDAGFHFSNESEASFQQAIERALNTSPETIHSWSETLLMRHNWPTVTDKIMRELAIS